MEALAFECLSKRFESYAGVMSRGTAENAAVLPAVLRKLRREIPIDQLLLRGRTKRHVESVALQCVKRAGSSGRLADSGEPNWEGERKALRRTIALIGDGKMCTSAISLCQCGKCWTGGLSVTLDETTQLKVKRRPTWDAGRAGTTEWNSRFDQVPESIDARGFWGPYASFRLP